MSRSTLTMKTALVDAGADALVKRMAASKTLHVHHHHHKAKPAPAKNPENLFIVKCPAGLAALKYWLQGRKFNTFVETQDKNGKPLLGLLWDYHLGKFPSPKRTERGAVLVLNRDLTKDAALIVLNAMAEETEYGRQWKQAQRDLWKYGRA